MTAFAVRVIDLAHCEENLLTQTALTGTHVLVLEDEYLIAMDVEQLCRESGAAKVTVMRSLGDFDGDAALAAGIDAAVLDVMLSGTPTLEFARRLRANGIPFIFATGYSAEEAFFEEFQEIKVVAKPYAAASLLDAISEAVASKSARSAQA